MLNIFKKIKYPLFKRIITLLLPSLLALSTSTSAKNAQKDSPVYLLDFVIMNKGYGLQERNAYEEIIEILTARYGMKIEKKLNITQFLTGDEYLKEVIRLNIWKVPLHAMKKLSADPDYQSLAKFRNRIHNMNQLSLFTAAPNSIALAHNETMLTGSILVDLVTMKPGFTLADREKYETKVAPITQKYGMTRFASYDIHKKLKGIAPDAIRLNLWQVSNQAAMKEIGQDPEYRNLIPYRNKIHDMQKVTLFFAEHAKK